MNVLVQQPPTLKRVESNKPSCLLRRVRSIHTVEHDSKTHPAVSKDVAEVASLSAGMRKRDEDDDRSYLETGSPNDDLLRFIQPSILVV